MDACCQAIDAVVGETGELLGFTTRSVSEGIDALAEVTVRVKDLDSGRTFVGHGTHVRCGRGVRRGVPRCGRIACSARVTPTAAASAARGDSDPASPRQADEAGVGMSAPKTLFEKIWERHVVRPQTDATPAVLYIDLHLVHEVTSPQAFTELRDARAAGARAAADGRDDGSLDADDAGGFKAMPVLDRARSRARRSSISSRRTARSSASRCYALGDERQGIVHVIGPELGLTQPGMTIVCGDSHTSTHGAFGALAFGIGTSRGRARARDAVPAADAARRRSRCASTARCAPA